MRHLISFAVVLCPALALAQPADEPPVEPPAPPPPPVAAEPLPPPAPPPAATDCKTRRIEAERRAWTITDVDERGRALAAIGDCPKDPPAETHPPTEHVRGTTFEISAGIAGLFGGNDSQWVHGIGGLNVGVGGFVTPQIALSLRVAGVSDFENGFFYLGAIGPHAQLWLGPSAWLGAGVGIGFIAGCGNADCGKAAFGASFDFRGGVVLSQSATSSTSLGIELVSVPIYNVSITSLSLTLGAQAF